MPGCCLVALLMFFGPRVLLACAWLLTNWYRAFDSSVIALAGWFLMPWTSLAWIYIHFHNRGALSGGYLLLIVFGVLLDVGTFGGSHHARRREYRD
jgi:hypothetical protein